MTSKQKKDIEALYLEMFDRLMVYAQVNLDSEALAEEAVQETFRTACQKPESLCGSPNPRGWLVNTLKNTIRNMKRSQAATKQLIDTYLIAQCREQSVAEDPVDLNVLYGKAADTEEFKLLVEMAIEGRSHEEMARARGITVAACRKRVQRAKEILQKRLKKNVTL